MKDRAGKMIVTVCALALIAGPASAYIMRPVVVPANGGLRTRVNIGWERDSAGVGTVHYGPTMAYGLAVTETVSRAHHVVTLTGLTPGQLYHYKCTDTTGYDSGNNTFRAGYPDGSVPFRIVVAGDNRDNRSAHQAVVNQLATWNAELYLHTADMVASGSDYAGWQTWFVDEAPLLSKTVFCPERGNHESGTCYDWFLGSSGPLPSSPGSGQYYSYNFGNLHVVALSSEMDINVQRTWLQSDLAAARADPSIQWIFAFWHQPMWTTSNHGPRTDIRNTWGPVFDQYRVDMVFCGHNHVYERSYPMLSNGTLNSNGTVNITIGCGGAPRYSIGSAYWLARASSSINGGMILDITGNTCRVRMVQDNGAVFDDFTIVRAPVEPPRCSFSPDKPGFGEPVAVTYNANLGPISNASPVYIYMGADNWINLVDAPMAHQGTNIWKYTYAVPLAATSRVACVFHDTSNPTNWDNNSGSDWVASVDRVGVSPYPPIAGQNCIIRYKNLTGPLVGKAAINAYIGYNGWATVISNRAMAFNAGLGAWEYTNMMPGTATQLDFVFNDGAGTWDNNSTLDWRRPVQASAAGTLQFESAAYSVSETGGSVRIYVSRTGGSTGAASVNYTTANGTAIAGSDYTTASGTLNWSDGDSASKYFDVPILDDLVYEGNETFTAGLSGATGASLGSPSSTTVTILDNETPPPPPPDLLITNPPTDIVVGFATSNYTAQGRANPSNYVGLAWTNSLTGGSGQAAIGASWSIPGIALDVGTNVITVTATNVGIAEVAADSATNSAYAGGWSNGSNGGAGWGAWALTNWGANAGFFISTTNDANLSIGPRAWGLWANSGNTAEAGRPLPRALAVGEVLSLKFDNNWILTGFSVGIGLQNAAKVNLFEFMFIGGGTNYVINDSTMGRNTLIPYSGGGWTLTFKLTSASAYQFTAGTNVITGTLTNVADLGITQFKAWNYSAGPGSNYNFYINDLVITGSGSGAATNARVSIIRQPASGFVDTDGDGMDDNWETARGLIVGVDDSGLDPDSDNIPNWAEYIADTNPQVSNALPRIDIGGDGLALQLRAGPSTTNSRLYELLWSSNLLQGGWNPWGSPTPGQGDGGMIQWTFTNTTDASMFYRTRVKLP